MNLGTLKFMYMPVLTLAEPHFLYRIRGPADVGGDGGRRGDSGSRGVDDETTRRVGSSVAAGNWSQAVIELDVLGAKNPRN